MALVALVLLRGLARWRAVPAALLVIVAGIVLDVSGLCHAWGVAAVGPISLGLLAPGRAAARPGAVAEPRRAGLRDGADPLCRVLRLDPHLRDAPRRQRVGQPRPAGARRREPAVGAVPGHAGGRGLLGHVGQRIGRCEDLHGRHRGGAGGAGGGAHAAAVDRALRPSRCWRPSSSTR